MTSIKQNIAIEPLPNSTDPAWASVMSARKEDRPQARDYIEKLFHGVFEMRCDGGLIAGRTGLPVDAGVLVRHGGEDVEGIAAFGGERRVCRCRAVEIE